MKCPKCNYLGFETGDRCKNCGYDFSLIDVSPPDDVDIDLTFALPTTYTPATTPAWAEEVDRALGAASLAPAEPEPRAPIPVAVAAPAPAAALPLFTPAADEYDDAPLIKLPATPRPPLAVRKTPDISRLRAVPRPAPRVAAEPVLKFADPPVNEVEEDETPAPVATALVAGSAGARLAAAAVDHVILVSIDAAVVYLTLRMAALTIADWSVLPLAPLATFLILLKASYFCAFTAIGGQTIGKMAMGLRVVTAEGGRVDGARAVRRTLAGTISAVALGLGFVPALIGSERRALHDHLAHTRVVDLHSA